MAPKGSSHGFIIFSALVLTLSFHASILFGETPLPKEILLVADEWAPYNMAPGTKPEGYIVDIAREIFAAEGITVQYRTVPWARALIETRAGRFTGVIGASTGDAPGFIFPDEPFAVNRLGFYTVAGSKWTFTGHESIETVTLGVIKGYDYRPWLSEYIDANAKNPKLVQIMVGESPLENNIVKLIEGRVDVIVDSQTSVLYTAKRMHLEQKIQSAGFDTEEALIHIAFSPADPNSTRYARIVTDGIAAMRRSGRLAEILAVYGLKDWK